MAITKHLLTTNMPFCNQYVTLGFFTQDDIEHHFGHFRMAADCNYCITTEDVAHTHAIDRAQLMLHLEAFNLDYKSSTHVSMIAFNPSC